MVVNLAAMKNVWMLYKVPGPEPSPSDTLPLVQRGEGAAAAGASVPSPAPLGKLRSARWKSASTADGVPESLLGNASQPSRGPGHPCFFQAPTVVLTCSQAEPQVLRDPERHSEVDVD